MKRILPIIVLALSILLYKSSDAAAAATLSVSPATGSQDLNTSYSINVNFDTGIDTVKTIKAYLTFPSNLLTVEDITTTGSVISTWTERLYSNTNGTINLSGDTASVGVTGTGKLLATVKFRVKAAGTGAVRFTSASQIFKLSDNTDVLSLTSSTNGSYTLGTSTTLQPTASPSGSVPKTGSAAEALYISLFALALITLGILTGRKSYQNS